MYKSDLTKICRIIIVLFFVTFAACYFAEENIKTNPVPSELSSEALKKIIDEKDNNYLLVDVRTPAEYKEGHIPSAILIPYDEIEKHTQEIPKDKTIVLYCHSGRRAEIALEKLKGVGYEKLINFGGITKWTYQTEK